MFMWYIFTIQKNKASSQVSFFHRNCSALTVAMGADVRGKNKRGDQSSCLQVSNMLHLIHLETEILQLPVFRLSGGRGQTQCLQLYRAPTCPALISRNTSTWIIWQTGEIMCNRRKLIPFTFCITLRNTSGTYPSFLSTDNYYLYSSLFTSGVFF